MSSDLGVCVVPVCILQHWGVYSLPNPPSPSVLSAIRGYMIVVFFLPLLVKQKWKKNGGFPFREGEPAAVAAMADNETGSPSALPPQPKISLWRAAIELAAWNFISQAVYNIGIRTESSARASFLGQTSVVMTPLFVAATGTPIPLCVWMGCLSTMVGLSFLSWSPAHNDGTDIDGNGGDPLNGTSSFFAELEMESTTMKASSKIGFSFGDCMILLSSAGWSIYLIRICALANHFQEVRLQGVKNALIAVFYTAWWMLDSHFWHDNLWKGWNGPLAGASWAILVFSALFPGMIADLMQQSAQALVPASEANVILSMEPIFTAALGFWFLGESLSWNESAGGCFLVVGSLIASGMTVSQSTSIN